jgi:hypothetical protein
MKLNNGKMIVGFLASALLLNTSSCDVNTAKSITEDEKKKDITISGNQEDAKLLVSASENYIKLINYCSFLKDTVVADPTEEVLISSMMEHISDISNSLRETSSNELVLLPKEDDYYLINQTSVISKADKSAIKDKKVFYQKLNTMVKTQIDVMETLNQKSKNFSLHVLAEESKDILSDYNSKIERLIK